jgi:iron complex outermembrane receptor protein
LTDTTPKWRATFNTYWESGKVSINLRESAYGPAKQLPRPPNCPGLLSAWAPSSSPILKPPLPLPATSSFSIGANNLFGIYPDKILLRHASSKLIASTAFVSKYPSFSSLNINGGYYYARLGVKF